MTTTVPATRADALAVAEAECARRYVLKGFAAPDPEPGVEYGPTDLIPTLPHWGVFDVDSAHDGRGGMVWVPGEGFQASPDEAQAHDMLRIVQTRYLGELMAEWERVTATPAADTHTVIRLDKVSTLTDEQRLRALVACYDDAKAAADAAAAELKEIADGIKAEIRRLHPNGVDFTVTSGALAHPLTLVRVTSRVFDTASAKSRLTEEQYDALCKDRESWVLKAKRG